MKDFKRIRKESDKLMEQLSDFVFDRASPTIKRRGLHMAVFLEGVDMLSHRPYAEEHLMRRKHEVRERDPKLVKIPKNRDIFGFCFLDYDEGKYLGLNAVLNQRNYSGIYYLDAALMSHEELNKLNLYIDKDAPKSEIRRRKAVENIIQQMIENNRKGINYVWTRNGLVRRFEEADSIFETGQKVKRKRPYLGYL